MLVLLLLLSSMFLQIDAVGEQIDPYKVNIAREGGYPYAPILRAAPTDVDIARSQVLESFNEMVANREQNPGVEIYDPAVNRLLDIYLNAADMDQVNQLADLVLQAYNRYTPELQQRGVQMPPLNQLGAPARIDASTFRNVGLAGVNGQPFGSMNAAILQFFNPEIEAAGRRLFSVSPLRQEIEPTTPDENRARIRQREEEEDQQQRPSARRKLDLDAPVDVIPFNFNPDDSDSDDEGILAF